MYNVYIIYLYWVYICTECYETIQVFMNVSLFVDLSVPYDSIAV